MAPDEVEGMIAAQLVGTSDRIRGDHAAECNRRIAAANVSDTWSTEQAGRTPTQSGIAPSPSRRG
jgi:hypothetical protein